MLYGIILNQGDSYDSLMELREMMEVGVMRIVMAKASDEEIERLREPLARLKEACMATSPIWTRFFARTTAFMRSSTILAATRW